MPTINLDHGKYRVVRENGAGLHALRNGEPWRDLAGDGLVVAMAQNIEDLYFALEALYEAYGRSTASEDWDLESTRKAAAALNEVRVEL